MTGLRVQTRRWHGEKAENHGFALPTILIMSIVLLAIGVSTLQVGAAISRSLVDQHWNRLAKSAGQSGVAFVSSCVEAGIISWASPLVPNVICNNAPVSPVRDIYLSSDTSSTASPSPWRTTYTVQVPVVGSDSISRTNIIGKVELLTPSGVVVKTYSWVYNTILNYGPQKAIQVEAGNGRACVTTSSLLVYCTGYNSSGAIGNGNTFHQSIPGRFQLPSGKLGQEFILQTQNTCTVTTDYLLYCAGDNSAGQLGDGTTTTRTTPVLFQLPAGKQAVKASTSTINGAICVLTLDQLVYCSGANGFGQLGNGNTTNQSTPVQFQLPAGKVAAGISVEDYNVCVRTGDQLVYCSGRNDSGQLGNGNTTNQSNPVQFQLPAGKTAADLKVSVNHVCAITLDQLVYCSGDGLYGKLGNGNTTNQSTPVQFQLPAGKGATQITTTSYRTCGLTTDQLVYCAGYNGQGQLGNGNTTDQSTPVQFQLPAGKAATAVSGKGYYTVCALTTDQLIYCAGTNDYGQLGNGNTTNQSTPVQFQLPAGKAAMQLSAGAEINCAITTDQLVYCAGRNTYGELGNGNTTAQSTPVKYQLP